jgi:hypothetical protein
VSTNGERAFKIVKDIVAMVVGSVGMLFQFHSGQLTILGVVACLVLMGIPLGNLRALIPNGSNGTADTRSSLQSSRRRSSQDGSEPSSRGPQDE